MNLHQKQFSLSLFITIIAMSAILVGCSSNQSTKRSQPQQTKQQQQKLPAAVSVEKRIQNAQTLPMLQATTELISANEQLLAEQQYHRAIWLAHQLLALTTQPEQKITLLLIKVEGLTALAQNNKATDALAEIEQFQQQFSLEPSLRYFAAKQLLLAQHQQVIDSIEAQLHAFAKTPEPLEDDIHLLWQRLSVLSTWQLEQLAMRKPPYINGWQQLLNFAFKFGHDSSALQRYLTEWQRNYSSHPANLIAKQLQATITTHDIEATNAIEKIAIILPLSGKQELAGKVAQQGILAAFENNKTVSLQFIDAEQLDMSLLPQQLIDQNIHYVIGPLLQKNVSAYLALDTLTIPTLLLNVPNGINLKPHQVAFSMRPEDEAIQAATTLSNKHFKHPLIISQQDNVSRRITQTFLNTWAKVASTTPDVIYLDPKQKMQNTVKSSLSVGDSQQRINQIKSRAKQTIKADTRNRRDTDMIYIVGSIADTRLIKPYIDVNISPFAKRMPIYASSRSHSAQSDASDSRDLTGLAFTEIPWLLKSQQQNTSLQQLSNTLWPNRSDGLQRIFAMGYDSLSLITKLETMKQLRYVRHYGQTGILQLSDGNILKRSFLWGKYSNEKAEVITMDAK